MKKCFSMLISLFLCLSACKNDKTFNNDTANKTSKKELPKQEVGNPENVKQKKTAITKAQFEAFFPQYIGSHKRFNVFIYPEELMATASYGSFDNSYNYSVYDAITDNSIIKNFEMSYNAKQIAPEGTEYIVKEREGYNTIAFLQPKIERYDIRFVYNNRFRVVLEGPEYPDILWSFIKKSDLEKLANN